MRDLSSPPGDRTQAPCCGSTESQLLDHQEGPWGVLHGSWHQCALGDSVWQADCSGLGMSWWPVNGSDGKVRAEMAKEI